MFDFDTEILIDDEAVPVRVEVESLHVIPPDPKSWDSPEDYYGSKEADFTAYRLDTWEPVEIDENTFWKILDNELEYE